MTSKIHLWSEGPACDSPPIFAEYQWLTPPARLPAAHSDVCHVLSSASPLRELSMNHVYQIMFKMVSRVFFVWRYDCQ